MAIAFATYQGIPLLDWDFSLKVGVEASRGWCRLFKSSLGGALPKAADITQLKEVFERIERKQADNQASFAMSTGDASTVVGTKTKDVKKQYEKLQGPWGVLAMHTVKDGDQLDSTLILNNIFWIEAVVEDPDATGGDAVVRLELADERILWDLGGYVQGDRNMTLNELDESTVGNILEWEPAVRNPTKVNDISQNVGVRETFRPVLREETLFHGKTPYLLQMLLIEAMQNLPGPPKSGQFTDKTFKIAPANVAWGAARMAKDALRDLLERYNLVIAPTYIDTYQIMDKSEGAFEATPGGGAASFSDLPAEFIAEKSDRKETAALQLKPLSVEVIGERVVESVHCPSWVNVAKVDDGDGSYREGDWVPMKEWLESIGYSEEAASVSLLANYDKKDSKAFDDCPPAGDDDESKEIRNKRKRILRQHFLKSFMVDGPFRRFLPMILKRAEPAGRGKFETIFTVIRPARFFVDSWQPDPNRAVGRQAFFANTTFAPVDEDDISSVNERFGIVTFKEAQGLLVTRSNLTFLGNALEAEIAAKLAEWGQEIKNLNELIQGFIDRKIRTKTDSGHLERNWVDLHAPIYGAVNEFLRQHAGYHAGDIKETVFDQKTMEAITTHVAPIARQAIPFIGLGSNGPIEQFNLSACRLIPPRLFGIWSWERSWGRSDDFYRLRVGKFPEAPAYPLKVRGLRMVVGSDGTTNRSELDKIAKMNAELLLESREKPIDGEMVSVYGFHKVILSGEIPEVNWRGSRMSAEAQTEFVRNRYQHGIAGRRPATATWTAFQRPIRSSPLASER